MLIYSNNNNAIETTTLLYYSLVYEIILGFARYCTNKRNTKNLEYTLY